MKDPNGTERLTCSGKTGTSVVNAAVLALADFKNPHDSTKKAVRSTGNTTGDADVGYTKVSASGNNITIETCFVTKCNVTANRVKNQVTVE